MDSETPYTPERLIAHISEEAGINILTRSRETKYLDARRAAYQVLHDNGHSLSYIGRLFGLDHSSILVALSKHMRPNAMSLYVSAAGKFSTKKSIVDEMIEENPNVLAVDIVDLLKELELIMLSSNRKLGI